MRSSNVIDVYYKGNNVRFNVKVKNYKRIFIVWFKVLSLMFLEFIGSSNNYFICSPWKMVKPVIGFVARLFESEASFTKISARSHGKIIVAT